jgi:hypothetical protein
MFPASQPNGRRHEQSGIHVSASAADFDEFPKQVGETTAFLQREFEQLMRLCRFPGVTSVTLDFGIERRDVAVQCDYLPPDLMRLASSLGIGIELSQYPISDRASNAETTRATDPKSE